MSTKLIEIESLTFIDHQWESNKIKTRREYSYAEYEIVRRIIQKTGDWEYQKLVTFAKGSIIKGAKALAAKTPIVMDSSILQTGLNYSVERTFINPIYCAQSLAIRRNRDNYSLAVNIEILAQRYPKAIFIIGEDEQCLITLLELIEANIVKSPLVIATPPNLVNQGVTKKRLQDSQVSQICTDGAKGNVVVALTIINALIGLAWQVYKQNKHNLEFIDKLNT